MFGGALYRQTSTAVSTPAYKCLSSQEAIRVVYHIAYHESLIHLRSSSVCTRQSDLVDGKASVVSCHGHVSQASLGL